MRKLPVVIGADTLGGELERRPVLGRHLRDLGGDFRRAEGERRWREIQPVEPLRELDQRRVAALADVGDDAGDVRVDFGRHLAPGVEQGAEPPGEVGLGGGEELGHPEPPCRAGHSGGAKASQAARCPIRPRRATLQRGRVSRARGAGSLRRPRPTRPGGAPRGGSRARAPHRRRQAPDPELHRHTSCCGARPEGAR